MPGPVAPARRRRRLGAGLVAGLVAVTLAGCPDDSGPAFPADYAATFVELRDCRKSGDHDLAFVRVLGDAAAVAPYQDRVAPFPDGSVVIKEEYDFADATCEGPIVQWTVMVKDASLSDQLGWSWQKVDEERQVVEVDGAGCIGCHRSCADQGVGHDGTCAEP
jgi:hypothetical protein